MNKLSNILILPVFLLLTVSSCIMDTLEQCEFHLRLKYDYNMDYVDKFMQQAKNLHVYIFDENSLFVDQIERSADEIINNQIDFIIKSKDYGKNYTFLAWVGIDSHNIVATSPKVGVTSIADFEVALNHKVKSSEVFEPLMVGEVTTVLEPETNAEVFLTKNTNKFRIAFRLPPSSYTDATIIAEDYNIYIESNNTRYNNKNEIISDEVVQYYPYYKKNDERGFVLEINTLRIVEKRHNILVIENIHTNEKLLRVDLNKYLEDLRFLSNSNMPRQEFFDREDEFAIIFFLSNTDFFGSFNLEINGWLIREQEYDELN